MAFAVTVAVDALDVALVDADLSLKAVQLELSVSHPTVQRLIREGRLAAFRIGRRRFVTREALAKFIRAASRDETRGAE